MEGMKKYWIRYSTEICILAKDKKDALKRFMWEDYKEVGSGEDYIEYIEENETEDIDDENSDD